MNGSIISSGPDEVHSKLGGSIASMFISCPGSVRLNANKESKSSIYAAEGTAAHALGEHSLKREVAPKDIGNIFEGTENEQWYCQNMVDAAQVYYDHIVSLNLDSRMLEERIILSDVHPTMFSTVDCIGIKGDTLHIIEYKHGVGVPVEVINNSQLVYYAVGALAHPKVIGKPINTVVITVVQPRAPHPDGFIRSQELTKKAVIEWKRNVLKPAVKLALTDNAPLKVGSHCRFCLSKATCPAQAEDAMETAKQSFSVIKNDGDINLPPAEELTDADIARVLDRASQIQAWCKEVAIYAQDKLEKGGKISGYKLVKKRSVRQWADESKLMTSLPDDKDLEIYQPLKIKSPNQMTDALKAIGYKNKEATKIIEPLTVKPDTGNTIVPLTDKRPAVEPQGQILLIKEASFLQ